MIKCLKAPNKPINPDTQLDWNLDWYVSKKLDGNRGLIIGPNHYTTSMKPFRNEHLIKQLFAPILQICKQTHTWLDFEIYSHTATHHAVISGFCNSYRLPIPPQLKICVFDGGQITDLEQGCIDAPFVQRKIQYKTIVYNIIKRYPFMRNYIRAIKQHRVLTTEHITQYFNLFLKNNYEGLMLRSGVINKTPKLIGGFYKHGRATMKQQVIFKMKATSHAYGEIVELNEAIDQKGQPLGRVGSLTITSKYGTTRISLGTGYSHLVRKYIWEHQKAYLGATIEYIYLAVGGKKDGGVRHGRLVGDPICCP